MEMTAGMKQKHNSLLETTDINRFRGYNIFTKRILVKKTQIIPIAAKQTPARPGENRRRGMRRGLGIRRRHFFGTQGLIGP